jgi:hypothetical protein
LCPRPSPRSRAPPPRVPPSRAPSPRARRAPRRPRQRPRAARRPLPGPAAAPRLPTDEELNRRCRTASIAPSKTSIYIGSVSLTVDPLVLKGGAYESKYVATVFPYFFYNERGSLSIDMPAELLRRVSRLEPVEFTGRAASSDGEERRISGKAVPSDATHGRIKVRIYVSKRIALIFNTTYELRP